MRSWLKITAVPLAIWALVGFFLVPWLLRLGYASDHPLTDVIFNRSRPENTIHYYLGKWRMIAIGGLVLIAAARLWLRVLRSRTFYDRFVAGGTSNDLGWIRIVVCGLLLTNALRQDLVRTASLPIEFTRSMGIISLLRELPIGFAEGLQSEAFLFGLQCLTIGFLALATVGLATRVSLPLAMVCQLLFGGILRYHTHFFHAFLIETYLGILLCFAPCGVALSLDRLIRKRFRGEDLGDPNAPSALCSWARFGCWTMISISYFSAGLLKLINGGLMWWHPTNLKVLLITANISDDAPSWGYDLALRLVNTPAVVFALLGLATLFIEMGYISILFSARARRIVPYLAALMHLSIYFLQHIFFLDLILLPLIFLRPYRWFTGRAASSEEAAKPHAAEPAKRLPVWFTWFTTGWLAVATLAAVGRIDKYPFTSWQMFSKRITVPKSSCLRLLAVTRSGERRIVRPNSVCRLFALDYLGQAGNMKKRSALCRILRDYSRQQNRSLAREDQMVGFEVQKFVWKFEEAPQGPWKLVKEFELCGEEPE